MTDTRLDSVNRVADVVAVTVDVTQGAPIRPRTVYKTEAKTFRRRTCFVTCTATVAGDTIRRLQFIRKFCGSSLERLGSQLLVA